MSERTNIHDILSAWSTFAAALIALVAIGYTVVDRMEAKRNLRRLVGDSTIAWISTARLENATEGMSDHEWESFKSRAESFLGEMQPVISQVAGLSYDEFSRFNLFVSEIDDALTDPALSRQADRAVMIERQQRVALLVETAAAFVHAVFPAIPASDAGVVHYVPATPTPETGGKR